jgi:probable F420-dependent oxidoreductase
VNVSLNLTHSFPEEMPEIAVHAETLGFDSIALGEHWVVPQQILSKYPYGDGVAPTIGEHRPFPDVWVGIGAMAAVTSRLRFITTIAILPIRHPFFVAKAAGTAALLSKHRFVLGVGLGWMREEFEFVGAPFEGRAEQLEESVSAMRLLWQEGFVEYHGRRVAFGPVSMAPAPLTVPVYLSGHSPAALRRAARIGNGYITSPNVSGRLEEILAEVERYRAEAGRADESFEKVALSTDRSPRCLARLDALGVSTISVTPPWPSSGGNPPIWQKLEALDAYAREIEECLIPN